MKKFLMLIISFTLFMSFSCALEFDAIPNPEACTYTAYNSTDNKEELTAFENTFESDTGYTIAQIKTISSYKNSSDSELVSAYTTAMNALSSKGYHFMYGSYTPYGQATRDFYRIVKTSTGFDVGYCKVGNYYNTVFLLNEGDLVYTFGYSKSLSVATSSGRYNLTYCTDYHNSRVKLLVDGTYVWTSSKGYKFEPTLCNAVGDVAPTPDTPSGNHDLAGLISAITSSDVIKDNTDATSREYFIVPYGSIDGKPLYDVYFYNSHLNLSAFEYLMNDNNLYYDLDKVSVDGVIAKIIDFFGGIRGDNSYLSNLDYFTLLYDSESSSVDVSYNGKVSFDGNDMCGFSSEKNPIIYTTKNISYYHYSKDETTGEWTATPDSSKDIPNLEIKDSSDVVISPVVEGSEKLIDAPVERIISAIRKVSTSILNGIKSLFVPDSDYFPSQFERLKTALDNKLPTSSIVSIMDTLKNVQAGEMAPITIELYGHTYTLVDFSYYEQYKPTINNWVRGFVYFFLILYWAGQTYKLIRGDTLSGNALTFGQMSSRTEGKK